MDNGVSPEWRPGRNLEVQSGSRSPAPLTLRFPAACPKFSRELPNSAGVRGAAKGGNFPSASRTSGRVYTEQPRRDGRGDAKVTPELRAGRGVAGSPAGINSPSRAAPPPGARAPPHERRPIPRESRRRLLGLLCLDERAPLRKVLHENRFAVFRHPLRHSPAARIPTRQLPAGPPPLPARPTPGPAPGVAPKGGMDLASPSPRGFTF